HITQTRGTLKRMDNAKEGAAPSTGPAQGGGTSAASAAGLRGVVAASSSIGDVNGERGELIYQGYNIHDLAAHSTFEEIVFLLWHGRLPNQQELDELKHTIGASYEVAPQVFDMMRQFPRAAEPMDTLRTAISALAFYDEHARDISREGALRTATRLTAQFPVIVAAIERLRMEVGEVEHAEEFVKNALAQKKKIMGIGHAVYRTEDPRATHLRRFSREMGERRGETKWHEISRRIEEIMHREKGMYANVDFYSASTYYMMGIPLDLYTPIFAVSRISGWTGHILEQYAHNTLI